MTRLVICTFYFNPNHAKPFTFSTPAKSEIVLKPAVLISLNRWPSPQLHQDFPKPGTPGLPHTRAASQWLLCAQEGSARPWDTSPRQSAWPKQQSVCPRTSGKPQPWISNRRVDNTRKTRCLTNDRFTGPYLKGPHFSVKTQRHRLRHNQSC